MMSHQPSKHTNTNFLEAPSENAAQGLVKSLVPFFVFRTFICLFFAGSTANTAGSHFNLPLQAEAEVFREGKGRRRPCRGTWQTTKQTCDNSSTEASCTALIHRIREPPRSFFHSYLLCLENGRAPAQHWDNNGVAIDWELANRWIYSVFFPARTKQACKCRALMFTHGSIKHGAILLAVRWWEKKVKLPQIVRLTNGMW